MEIVFPKPCIYFSHPIRGSNNKIKENCERAIRASNRLQNCFPDVMFYCPGAHDLTMQILTENNKIDIPAIMEADLQILRACHEWMFYRFDRSSGSLKEWVAACEHFHYDGDMDACRWVFDTIEKMSYARIRTRIGPIVEQAICNFRRTK